MVDLLHRDLRGGLEREVTLRTYIIHSLPLFTTAKYDAGGHCYDTIFMWGLIKWSVRFYVRRTYIPMVGIRISQRYNTPVSARDIQ